MCLAVPGRLIEINTSQTIRMGKIDFGGVLRDVCLEYLPDLKIGDYALVHVGFAISQIDEESANMTLDELNRIGIIEESDHG